MSGALQHRGSDDEGYVLLRRVDGAFAAYCGDDSPEEISGRLPLLSTCYNRPCFDVGLAHRRFSIIDPSHRGHQPFLDSSGVGCLAFNGEIYNYVELKRELEGLGHCFRTGTDTEVLLEAYKAWGTECFTRFNGMWALATEVSSVPLTTYTIRYPDKQWNEEPFARRVADACKTEYRVVDSPFQDFWNEILEFTYLQEEPYHLPNIYTNQIIRRLMRAAGFKVVLAGTAGDELFAGYMKYFPLCQAENLRAGRFIAYFDNLVHWTEQKMSFKQVATGVTASLLESTGSPL